MSRRPAGVALWQVAVGALAAGLLVAGLIGLVESLRPADGQAVEARSPDPRIEVDCFEPEPREGEPRDTDALTADEPIAVTAADLHDCPGTFDGSAVRYEGEVVGAVLRRDDGAWAQLNGDPYAMEAGPLPGHRAYRGPNQGVGVLLPHDVADRVAVVGGPGQRGDLLAVTGEFRRVDPDSGEIALIRVDDAEVVRAGGDAPEDSSPDRGRAAWLLSALAAGMIAAERLHARRWRRG